VIVVDASAIVEVLLRTRDGQAIEERLFEDGQTLHVPHLVDIEIAHAVRRYAISGQIDSKRGRTALAVLADLPLNRHPHAFLLPRIWDLRNNLTAYDSVYVALAEVLRAPLLTRDRRLAAAAGHRARIELV
jgi:predicted nucleic acid-binding protein